MDYDVTITEKKYNGIASQGDSPRDEKATFVERNLFVENKCWWIVSIIVTPKNSARIQKYRVSVSSCRGNESDCINFSRYPTAD